MAAGYTGPLVALDVDDNDLFDLSKSQDSVNKVLQARAALAQTQAQTEDQQLKTQQLQTEQPAVAAETGQRVARANTGVLQAQAAALQSQDALIARAASQVDPAASDASAQWDLAMQGAAKAGAADATQFVGKFTPKLLDRVVQNFAAPNPLAAASANAAGGMPSSAFTPQQGQQWDTMFQGQNPQQLTAAIGKLDTYKQALERVMQSPNPSAQWNTEAQALGHGAAVGNFNPLRLQQMYQEVAPMEAYLQNRVAQAAAGVPAPVPQTDVKEAGGTLYGVTPGPQGPSVKPLTPQGQWTLQGTDPTTGVGIYRNSVTGEEKASDKPLAAKPGTSNLGRSTFEKKQKAWLDTHPGDEQGALDFAGGKKSMTPQQATEAATAQAARDLQALTLGGQPPPDPAAFLKQTAAEHYTAIMSAGGTAAPGGAALPTPPPAPYADPGAAKAAPVANPGPSPPARAIAKLKEGIITPFANGTAWTLRNGKPVRVK